MLDLQDFELVIQVNKAKVSLIFVIVSTIFRLKNLQTFRFFRLYNVFCFGSVPCIGW